MIVVIVSGGEASYTKNFFEAAAVVTLLKLWLYRQRRYWDVCSAVGIATARARGMPYQEYRRLPINLLRRADGDLQIIFHMFKLKDDLFQ
jgi:hypothetical protein